MTCPQPDLRDIQAWLHTFVVAPGSSQEALKAAEREAGFEAGSAESLILPSPTLSPQERIQIYRRMYLLRMEEALEIDFPAVQARAGKDAFFALVSDYVEAHPSHSYTLDHLGRYFPDFLREGNALDEGSFVAELAALEWSICESAIALNSSVLNLADMASVASDRFLDLTFTPIPALRLHRFRYNINEVYRRWSHDDSWLEVESEETFLVVWRQDLEVWRRDLDPASYHFLAYLLQGLPLGESLDRTLETYRVSEEQCFEWFQQWLEEGFFCRYQIYTKVGGGDR